jgi:hypothetical protein
MKALRPALLALLLVQPLRAATVVAEPFPPARFTSLYIEWDVKRRATTIQLVNDTLVYKVMQGDKVLETSTVRPSSDTWFKFIQDLNNAKVYNWAEKYYYPGQGDSWVIDATMNDRKFLSGGTNEYPKSGDEAQPQANPASGPSVPFQLFWQAALQLAGKWVPPTQCPGKGPAAPATK